MKPTFERSPDVEKLVSYLADRPHASYSEMSAHIGRPLTAEDRLAFSIARVVLNAIGKTTRRSFRSQIAKEIERRDGHVITTTSLFALPRFRRKS